MKNKARTTLGLMALLAASGGGLALAGAPDPALAKLPKEIQPMHCLVGSWEGPATFQQGAKKAPLKVTMRCEATSAGYAISCRTQLAGMPSGRGAETDLFGYDADANKYHWFAVTDMGDSHDHVADVPKGPGPIAFVYHGTQDGKPFTESITLAFNDETHIAVHTEGTLDGKPLFSLQGTASKQ